MYTNSEAIGEQQTMAAIQNINQKIPELKLRDLFAMHALSGLVQGDWGTADCETMAKTSYRLADEMLKARSKK